MDKKLKEEFEKSVTINIDMKPVLMYGKRATDEISNWWEAKIHQAVAEERERVVDEITRFAIINRYEGERYFEIPESVILSLKSKSLKDK